MYNICSGGTVYQPVVDIAIANVSSAHNLFLLTHVFTLLHVLSVLSLIAWRLRKLQLYNFFASTAIQMR